MRPLTRSESILIGLCVFSVLVMGHLIAYKQYSLKVKKAEQMLQDLARRGDRKDLEKVAKTPASETRMWKERMAWLEEQLPSMENRDQAQAALLEDLRASAKSFDLDIDGQSFVKPASTPHYQEVAVKMVLDGPERKVFQWLAGLQSPEKFQVLKFLDLEPEGRRDRPESDCQVIVGRWFKR
jgi:hypothetical protein